MLKFLAGVLVGLLVVGVAAVLLGRELLEEKYAFGRRMGQIDGRSEAMEAIRSEFGEVQWSPAFTSLFTIKTSVAVATEVNGVKTIRVVP